MIEILHYGAYSPEVKTGLGVTMLLVASPEVTEEEILSFAGEHTESFLFPWKVKRVIEEPEAKKWILVR